jgi:RHS repeat-associated protein
VSGLASDSSGSYTYDANGNTLSDPSGKQYTWDFENRLVQAIVPGTNGGTTTFRYDPFGRRIQKSGPLGTTNYLYDAHNLLEEVDSNGNVLAKHTQGSHVDEPLSELRSATIGYYEQDGLGSSTSLSNSAGALANTYTYDSFGKLIASTGTFTNFLQYTSREFDSESGLYSYRARYFDPSTGRFISEDPIGLGGGLNFYQYVRNNPILLNDPLGLRWTNTGVPAPPNTNTIVCNGLGGINVQIGINQDQQALHCLYTCLWAHEESHWRYAIAANPGVCNRAAAGVQVASTSLQEIRASELAAYNVEINCLTGMLQHGCGQCRQIVRDRINQITPIRNGYR